MYTKTFINELCVISKSITIQVSGWKTDEYVCYYFRAKNSTETFIYDEG